MVREFKLKVSNDRNIVIYSYLVDLRYSLDDRVQLYKSMMESGLFSEYSQIFQVDNFLTPIYLQQHTQWSIPYEQVDLGKADIEVFYKRELEYRKKKSFLHKVIGFSSDLERVSLSELQDEIAQINNAIKLDAGVYYEVDAKAAYEKAKTKVLGIQTGIAQIDEVAHGIGYGTMTCIFGWTGHNKTTLALNMAYQAIRNSFNVLYINFETSKERMYNQALSLHSFYEAKRLGGNPVEYLMLDKGKLSEEEENFVFNKVEPDLKTIDGKIAFVGQSEFTDLSYSGMVNLCASFPFEIDVVIVDYFNKLLPYIDGGNEFMRGNRLAIDFTRLAVGDKVNKEKIVLLLAQANKAGYRKAVENDGQYDEDAIADIPELKNSAYYILSVYKDKDLMKSNELKVCLLKHRGGRTIWEPLVVPVDNRFAALGSAVRGDSIVGVGEVANVLSGNFDLKKLLGG